MALPRPALGFLVLSVYVLFLVFSGWAHEGVEHPTSEGKSDKKNGPGLIRAMGNEV